MNALMILKYFPASGMVFLLTCLNFNFDSLPERGRRLKSEKKVNRNEKK